MYADDLVIIAELPQKNPHVNMGKTKITISSLGIDVLRKSGKDLCTVCLTGLGNNDISCSSCSCWVHKKCSGLVPDPNFKCIVSAVEGEVRAIDGLPLTEMVVHRVALEVVASFYYLGNFVLG